MNFSGFLGCSPSLVQSSIDGRAAPGVTQTFDVTYTSGSGLPPQITSVSDFDGDGVPDGSDNCPFEANANQADGGGAGAGSPPDGIGDACQCGDVNGDHRVTLTDAVGLVLAVLLAAYLTITLFREDS